METKQERLLTRVENELDEAKTDLAALLEALEEI
jgi:hypothetical protein